MNWGTKAVLGLAIFMAFIITLAVMMFNSKTDALVDNDYYEKGIHYNQVYNRKEQVNRDQAKPLVAVTTANISLTFQNEVKGTLRLMRTSDKKLDRVFPFESSNNQVIIPQVNLRKGSWRLIIDWVGAEKSYLYEQEINLK